MPIISDGEIRAAIRRIEYSGKQETLVDGGGHGTGRLILILKPMPTRVTADWMAQQWRDKKRVKRKIGSYPSISLASAREIFDRDFAKIIQKGRSIKIATDTRPGTVADLFAGYVAALKAAGKPSWKETEKGLNKIANTLGRHRLAREIDPEEIVEVIRPIYERGARAMADHVRSYVHAAYGWGMKSEHDYRNTSPRRFFVPFNPASAIPTEPKVRGTRWLDETEFSRLYWWLDCPDVPVHPSYPRAIQLIMLTGQRVEEIARFHVDQWDASEKIIDWSKTKNEQPHAVPVPSLAAELIESITPNSHGWYFPSAKDPSRPVSHGSLYSFVWRQRDRGVIPYATNRDLRRTFKTLGGKAGISKEIRDRLQNHALQDVSSKSYDRWNYMPQKRTAMKKWDAYLRTVLARKAFKEAA
ncbi:MULTISPECIES: tyrosine-type recombinase/integrase [unclassified Mesorhizobium]|uniref:tyrosine-type recombinase/integrase n=1 Tax=unclassified Mesorhizobium TaxID=325217 RepID=UPI00112B1CB9|nr:MULTISPECIES: site-specific integrase [unclassified Mesorhizobium]MBZ9700553.1 tyrosine-type recombinase/integrase [Mesorhizobium sp. CO1-1-3]MBZ9946489.1 tyrosine-type recombinase/integrase [Mesorhizobium sp. BR1-1-11]TPI96520.1 site-specific integrase [Mesorhizobium sp. B2-8-1]